MAVSVATGIDDFIKAAMEQYRAKLLDLSSRNPLVNFRHSERSRSHIRVVDEIPEKLFEKLETSRQLWFAPLPEPVLIPPDEERPLFTQAFRNAKGADERYKKALEAIGPTPSDRQRQKIERELRNRVRVQIGLPAYEPTDDPKKHAVEVGIRPDYDLPKSDGTNRRRHTDNNIQSLYFREDLERKLGALRESARSLLQDAGLSALFCAFGFLEYYESDDSDEKRIAPLVFYPVQLDRELQNGAYQYFISGRNEDIEINVALRELLKKEYALELPQWTQDDDEPDPLGKFLTKVERVIRSRPNWKLRRYVTVGLFTFSTLVMYKDLDPEKWPKVEPLHKNPLLRTLIAGAEVHGSAFAPEYEIDKIPGPEALLITDADSSQHSAVVDVLQGKNIVVQGPPGTGKSQTITNIISAALDAGKSVLFVAEKMAALEVVKKRIDSAGLGPFCLELHSSKTSKTAIIQSFVTRLEYQPRQRFQSTLQSNLDALQKARKDLVYYVEKTNEAAGETGLMIRDVLLGSGIRDSARAQLPPTMSTARFPQAMKLTPHIRKQMNDAAVDLEGHTASLKAFGPLSEHPWRGLQNSDLTELETDNLLTVFRDVITQIAQVLKVRVNIEERTQSRFPANLNGLTALASSVINLAISTGQMNDELFRKLNRKESRESAATLISLMTGLSSARLQLEQYVLDPEVALLRGSSVAQTANDSAIRLSVGDSTITHLKAQIAALQNVKLRFAECARAAAEVTRAFGVDTQTFRDLRASYTAIEQLQKLPRDLWPHRSPNILQEGNNAAIKRAVELWNTLHQLRQELESEWDSALLPSASELKAYVIALRSANTLTAFFNSRCRAARSLLRIAYKGAPGQVTRQLLADNLSEWAHLLEAEAAFASNRAYSTLLGEMFTGLDSDFTAIGAISIWAEETRTALEKFGSVGEKLCSQLFESPTDHLRKLCDIANNVAFQELGNIISQGGNTDSATLEELISDLDRRCTGLESLVSAGVSLTFSEAAALSQLSDLSLLLRDIEKRRRGIEQYSAELDLDKSSPGTLEQLKFTVEGAQAIAATQFSSELKNWMHEGLGNVDWLKSQSELLSKHLAITEQALRNADHLASFDWSLWAKCSDLQAADLHKLHQKFILAVEYSRHLQDYVNFLLSEDAASDAGLGPVLAAFMETNVDYLGLSVAADFVFYRSAAEQVLEADPRLRRHSGSSHDQLRAQYRSLDKEYIALRRQSLAAKICQRDAPIGIHQGRVSELTEMSLVQYVAGQVRPRLSVRDLFRRAGNAIQALSPCWMMSPMSVAQFLEPGHLAFDLVIMDEASQIRPEESLGAVARARQIVIVGDQMQLPPTSFFQRLSSDGGDDDEELEDVQQESVLEAAAARFHPARMLKWHYRSEHGSLISFSNHEFYRDELTVFPSPYHDDPQYGVKLRQIEGVYGAGVNEQEARAVVEEARTFMSSHPSHSLGIVAVNSKQAELLRELIDQLCASEPEVEAYREKWSTTLESLFVKNLENVQGDERDVIFVSTVYGKDNAGNFYQRFGPINSAYGHRRLNVLFTRAKKKVVVFSSMKPEEIQDEGKSWGVRALKAYLQFARNGSWLLPTSSQGECDSEFEEWVLRVLREKGYEAVPQLGFAGYRIDLAVRHPKHPGTFLCGIECDGATYHSGRSVRERDRLRQEVLERLGWNIYRIWSTDWFRNPKIQTHNLLAHLERLSAKGI